MSPRARLAIGCVAVALIGAVAAAVAAPVRATYGARLSADEPHYLLTAISLAEDGDLDVSDEFAAERYRPFHELALPPQAAERADGSMLVPHDPLLPAVLALPWRAGGWLGAKLALAAVAGALGAALVWTAVRRLGIGLLAAVVTTGVLVGSAPFAAYGAQLYPELPAALVTTLAVAAALGPVRPRSVAALVTAVVALPWLAVKYAPVAAAVAALALWRWWRRGHRRAVGVSLAAFAVAGAGFAAAHLAWYGGLTPYAAGDFFREHGGQLTVVGTDPAYLGRARRLVGLLVDDEFGLAAWQPAWLLTVPALAALLRRRPDGWELLAVPLGVGWLEATFVALTMQGWWFPGRQVVVVLPLAALLVARWADGRAGRLAAAGLLGGLGVATWAWLVAEGRAGDLALIVDFAATANPWYARVWKPLLVDYLDVTWVTWAKQTAWLAALGLLAVAAWRAATPDRARSSGGAGRARAGGHAAAHRA